MARGLLFLVALSSSLLTCAAIDENVSTCAGEIHPGACPGASNIRCCTDRS